MFARTLNPPFHPETGPCDPEIVEEPVVMPEETPYPVEFPEPAPAEEPILVPDWPVPAEVP